MPKKSLTEPQHSANTKPAPPTHGPIKVPNIGSGQTWINLTKKEVDDYQRAQPQSQDKEVRRSSLGKLAAAIRWLVKYPFRP